MSYYQYNKKRRDQAALIVRTAYYNLDLLDLEGVKLDRRVAAKHTDHDAELAFGVVYFGDSAVEALERTVDNIDDFANRKIDLVFWIFDTHALLDFGDLCVRNWSWLGAATDKASDARCVADNIPSFVGQFHLD